MEKWERATKLHLQRAPSWLLAQFRYEPSDPKDCFKCGRRNPPDKPIEILCPPYFEVPVVIPVRLKKCPGPHTRDRWVCHLCVGPRAMRDQDYPVFEENFAPYDSSRDGKYVPICEPCFYRREGEFVAEEHKMLSLNWKCDCEKDFEAKVWESWFCHDCSIQNYDQTIKEVIREAVRTYDLVSRKLETEERVVCGNCDFVCISREELVSFSPRWYMCAGCRTPRVQVVEDVEDHVPPVIKDPTPSLAKEPVVEPPHVLPFEGHPRRWNVKRVLYRDMEHYVRAPAEILLASMRSTLRNMNLNIGRPTEVFLASMSSTSRKTKIIKQGAAEPSPVASEGSVEGHPDQGHLIEGHHPYETRLTDGRPLCGDDLTQLHVGAGQPIGN